jgi:hypothetical protein
MPKRGAAVREEDEDGGGGASSASSNKRHHGDENVQARGSISDGESEPVSSLQKVEHCLWTADCFRQEPDPSVLDAVSDGEDVTNDLHTYISKVEMDNFMGSGSDWNVNSVHNSNIFIQIEQMHR